MQGGLESNGRHYRHSQQIRGMVKCTEKTPAKLSGLLQKRNFALMVKKTQAMNKFSKLANPRWHACVTGHIRGVDQKTGGLEFTTPVIAYTFAIVHLILIQCDNALCLSESLHLIPILAQGAVIRSSWIERKTPPTRS